MGSGLVGATREARWTCAPERRPFSGLFRVRSQRRKDVAPQPRPTNGILLAITVMNSTLASSGRLAM